MDSAFFGASLGRLRARRHDRAWGLGASLAVALSTLLTLLAAATPAFASTTYFVDVNAGSDSNSCLSAGAGACMTIAHAVSLAADGDTISIAGGTYPEAVSTAKNLTFTGAGSTGSGATLIDSTNLSAPALALSGTESVSDLALQTNQGSIGGALNVSGSGTVTATGLAITTGATPVSSTQNGSDGIDDSGAALSVSDSTVSVTNTDTAIQNTGSGAITVSDGSGIEDDGGGALTVTDTTVQTVRGIALRIRSGTTSTTVRDSALESSGVEDYTSGETDYEYDQWPVVEAASGTVQLLNSTVYNATIGLVDQRPSSTTGTPTEEGPATDGIWVPNTSSVATPATVTIKNTIVQAQQNPNPGAYGADIDAGVPVAAADSAFTTVATNDTGTVTPTDTDGNSAGDPGLNSPLGSPPDFTLATGSALLGAGDATVDTGGELDLGGHARDDSSCNGGALTITNIGALERAAPSCPTALSSGDSTGALTQLTGANNCISGDAASGCGTTGVNGMTGGTPPSPTAPYDAAPTDTVQSADGKSVYVATEDPADNGVDIAELARGGDGSLSELPSPDNCVEPTGGTGGCGTTDPQLLYGINAFTNKPAFDETRMAISPDGQNLYVDTSNGIAEYSRDPTTGALTPLPSGDCIAYISSTTCAFTQQEQVAHAAAMLVSPNGKTVYVATLNDCSFALSAKRSGRARSISAATAPADDQNLDCSTSSGHFAAADIAVLTRDPTTGVLTPGPCYDNSATPQNNPTCSGGFDGLYSMTSLALSSDGRFLYVSSDSNAASAGGTDPFGALSRDPGEITELSVDPSTGALTQIGGAGACVTAGTGCGNAGDTGIPEVPGAADPQQIVLSPDGLNAYVTGAQYIETTSGNGPLVGTTLIELSRDPNSGALTPIADATCFTGYHEACGTAGGPGANVTQVPGLTGAEALAISPDGDSAYATAQNTGTNSAVVEFSRDATTGLLTPLSTPDLCLSNGSAPGASSPYQCGSNQPAGLSGNIDALPGGVLVAPNCLTAEVMSDGLAEFARGAPAVNCLSSVGFSEPALAFNTAPSTTSPAQTVTVTNNGAGNLVFGPGALTLGGTDPADFTITGDTCSSETIAPTATCTFSVDFSAPGSGSFDADVLLADNAPGSPQTFELRGTGGAAAAALAASSITFGSATDKVAVGSSQTQVETITDSGSASLVLGTLSLSGAQASEFAIGSDACSGQTLAANTSCKVSIKYAPAQPGSDSAQLNVADNAAGSPQTVALSGFAGTPSVALRPSSLSFLNTSSQTVAVQDASADTELTVTAVSVTGADAGDFTETNNCTVPITPGGSCAVTVTFDTQANGTFHAELSIADNGAGSPHTVALTGVETHTVVGTVDDATEAPALPVGGAAINACPQNGSGTTGQCQFTSTGADGTYGFQLAPGSWLLQLSPPDVGNLFGAQAIVHVTAGHVSVQNFDLTPPTPLNGGISINGQTSGEPTVNWAQPISMVAPLHLPTSGTPNTTNLFMVVGGLTGAGGSGADTGLDMASLTMFGVHYGADGLPDAMGPSLTTQLDCGGTPSPCAAPLSSTSLTGTGAASAARARTRRSSARIPARPAGRPINPIAQVAGCPPASVDLTIHPGELNAIPTANGIHYLMDFGPGNGQWDLGTLQTVQPYNFAPPPIDPDFPTASAALALPGPAVNAMINGTAQTYNAFVTGTQALSTAPRVSDPALAQQLNNDASIEYGVASLGEMAHGATAFVQKQLVGHLEGANMNDTQTTLRLVLNCPPQVVDFHVDPSGTVKTTTGIPVAGAKVVLSRSGTAKGKQRQVPNGSDIMAISNRRNPDHTSALGAFHWDVLPGFYQIKASHPSCKAVSGRSAFGLTPILAVPPPRMNLSIKLRCKQLPRAATRLTLRIASKGKPGGLIQAGVTTARGRRIASAKLPGQVTFKLAGVITRAVPVDVRHGWAFFYLPLTKHKLRLLTAAFSGNGDLRPSTARLKNP
jgi:hypothetical protein